LEARELSGLANLGLSPARGEPAPIVDFDYTLNLSKNAFVLMRYIYEGFPGMSGGTAVGILVSARTVILERHPEWENRTLQ
jgi:hypothetical protein